jgi:DNA modification methylase
MTLAPGMVRDAIVGYLEAIGQDASIAEIYDAVVRRVGVVPPSSVRSYLNLNSQEIFERTDVGRYRLKLGALASDAKPLTVAGFSHGRSRLLQADCFEWLAQQEPCSIEAVVTDPPYGLVEYTPKEQAKLRNGKGGVWRIPPSFDGHKRSPLPRFTVLDDRDRQELHVFFRRLAVLLARVLVPGANIVVASNPLLGHVVSSAMVEGGLELRGNIIRLVMTLRGGDRPKNAHHEFSNVSVMPRSMWEPWIVLRKPLEGRVQDNLRKWKTGGFRRPLPDKPFADVIKSGPTAARERKIASHPSLKPQAFLRQVVRGVLPLGEGTILDPFAGAGSGLAAANSVGYKSIGLEIDAKYFQLATKAIPGLSDLVV